MSIEFARIIQLAVGLVFLWSTVGKLRDRPAFMRALRTYEAVPSKLIVPAAALVIVLEAFVAIAHLTGFLLAIAVPAALLFLFGTAVVVGKLLWEGKRVACSCFGAGEETVSTYTLCRIALVIAAEAIVFASLSADRPEFLIIILDAREIGLTLLCALTLIVLLGWILLLPVVIAGAFAKRQVTHSLGKETTHDKTTS